MNKKQYMIRLEQLLLNMPLSERKEILFDINEHFSAALENGEIEEEIINKLGSPEDVARQYRGNIIINEVSGRYSIRGTLKAIIAFIGLGFVNILLLGPFFAVVGVLIGLFGVVFAFVVSGLAFIVDGLWGFVHPTQLIREVMPYFNVSHSHWFIMQSSFGVMILTLGGMMGVGVTKLVRGFIDLVIKYLKMNLTIIRNN